MRVLNFYLLTIFLFVSCGSSRISKTVSTSVIDCGSFVIDRIGPLGDSTTMNIEAVGCMDGVNASGGIIIVEDARHNKIGEYKIGADGKVKILLTPSFYSIECRAYPYNHIRTATNEYSKGNYNIVFKLGNGGVLLN